MSQKLWALPKKGHETFTRPKIGRAKIVNSILVPMDLEKMTTVMIDFLKKEKQIMKNYLRNGFLRSLEEL